MSHNELAEFVLVDDTSLGLRYGYRESDDIDLFCHPGFDPQRLRDILEASFPGISITSVSGPGVFANLDGVKVDFVKHPQAWLEPHETLDGIRMASLQDVSAMKINAVIGRGSKKDFSDLLFLHENGLVLSQSLRNFELKYGNSLLFAAIRSLGYFDDTRGTADPLYLNGWTWEEVQRKMTVLAKQAASK
ncbi:MAG: nucleotidyl transferase AbiEii/AbiGii toxin family protein [Spirochaetales bacterium]